VLACSTLRWLAAKAFCVASAVTLVLTTDMACPLMKAGYGKAHLVGGLHQQTGSRLSTAPVFHQRSRDSTLCGCWLACASMAVAACEMIWVRANSVVAAA